MNKLQREFLEIKAVYEGAFKAQNWEVVEEVEDAFVEKEIELVQWSLDVAVDSGAMTRKDADNLFTGANTEQFAKLVDLALRLKA